jgi:hypothetical protein
VNSWPRWPYQLKRILGVMVGQGPSVEAPDHRADLAATLPALELDADSLRALAGEVLRIRAALADAEKRLATAGPAVG